MYSTCSLSDATEMRGKRHVSESAKRPFRGSSHSGAERIRPIRPAVSMEPLAVNDRQERFKENGATRQEWVSEIRRFRLPELFDPNDPTRSVHVYA